METLQRSSAYFNEKKNGFKTVNNKMRHDLLENKKQTTQESSVTELLKHIKT